MQTKQIDSQIITKTIEADPDNNLIKLFYPRQMIDLPLQVSRSSKAVE